MLYLLPMALSHIWEFLVAVVANWRTVIAGVIFFLFSFPNAVLSEQLKLALEQRVSSELRRKIAVAIATIYVLVACFLAWDDEHVARLSAEATGQDNGRHLTADQKARLAESLKLSPQENYWIEFNSVANCDECEDYAEELRGFVSSVPGWKATGDVITFAGFAQQRGLKISANTSSPEVGKKIVHAFELASISLVPTDPYQYQDGLNAIVVVARRPK